MTDEATLNRVVERAHQLADRAVAANEALPALHAVAKVRRAGAPIPPPPPPSSDRPKRNRGPRASQWIDFNGAPEDI